MAIGGADKKPSRESPEPRERDGGNIGDAEVSDEVGARQVRADSDELLGAVRELQQLEAEKRGQEISSPEFHATAREITQRARDIFRRAAEEEKHGAATGEPQDRTTEEVPPVGAPEARD